MAKTKEIRLLRADEIECRVQSCGRMQNGNVWCNLLLYKDARCDMRILDEVFGIFGWKREHSTVNNQLCCTVSVKDDNGEWVSKQDVGVESNTEAVKGNFSDAFKRACFNFGIGRELYTAPKIFITLNNGEWIEKNGKPALSSRTSFSVKEISYDNNRNINALVIVDNKGMVRYKLGDVIQESQQGNAEGSDVDDMYEGYALPAIRQARSREELTRIWNDYPQLQEDQRFISELNKRQNDLNKAA